MEMTAGYKSIDMDTWPRKSCYEYYALGSKCMCAISAEIDVTELYRAAAAAGRDFDIAFMFAVTQVLNAHEEFKVGYCSENGQLMVWDRIVPVHRVFHEDTENFTRVCTNFSADFDEFYRAAQKSVQEGLKSSSASVRDIPENNFEISFIPWLHFTAVNTKMSENGKYLAPVVTVGRADEKDGAVKMPMTMQISHAVADGFHIARFFTETESFCRKLAAEIA